MMKEYKKPELLVTAKNLTEVDQLLSAGADALELGGNGYGLRSSGEFSLEMIKEALDLAHSRQAKIYVAVNAILHNEALTGLAEYLSKLAEYRVDAVIYGDPAVLVTAQQAAPDLRLHLSSETVSTNVQTLNYWAEKGVKRGYLSRELSLEEVFFIKQRANIEVQLLIHGATCIFHSKRELISNYREFLWENSKLDVQYPEQAKLYLLESQRPTEKYPIFEDRHGSHIMSSQDICMIDHLKEFVDAGIDSLKIDGLLHTTEYLIQVTQMYRRALDQAVNTSLTDGFIDEIRKIQPENRPLGTGFYFKEQIY